MTSEKAREFVRSHVLGLVAIFIALTGTAIAGQSDGADGPNASASVVTKAKFKKLKQRVAALEGKPDQVGQLPASLPPSGPAGGVLTGAYPNPGLAANSVGAAQISAGAVEAGEIASGAVDSTHFAFRAGTNQNVGPVGGETCVSGFSVSVPFLSANDFVLATPPHGFPTTFTLTGVPDVTNQQVDVEICNHFTGGGSADPDGTGGVYKIAVIR